MSIDSSGSVVGPVGLTVPLPQEKAAVSESVPEPIPEPEPPPAPLPAYQGNVIDESV
ncbi:hypothetical protein [Gracilinema caldarium]|uniref:Uncharacterized protein n=1 Tax=Gracilinema caldarium (strain ATCC 51460 / DSM 7334 / H1) TaxID=744872 RepID=F8EZJ7_GRAC1|nr:hypothetical protein [Gracilinema caldarium]AEJ20721.1 hypothetical protein Spica_2623 [Gracilinema caldarium DSM 7334]